MAVTASPTNITYTSVPGTANTVSPTQASGGGQYINGAYYAPGAATSSAPPSSATPVTTPQPVQQPAPTQTYTPQQTQSTVLNTGQSTAPATSSIAPPATTQQSSVNNYGLTPASGQSWYQLQPGETIANYNARIAAQNPNLPAPGTTSTTGVTNTAVAASQPGVASSVVNPNINTPLVNTNPNLGSSTGSPPTYTKTIAQLDSTATAGSPVAAAASTGALTTAQDQTSYNQTLSAYQTAVQNLQNFQNNIAVQQGKMETSDEALPIVLGTEGALQKQYAGQLQALQDAVTSTSNALNAGVNEQNAQTTAYSTAGDIANTAQSTSQTGLAAAATAAAPIMVNGVLTDPQTGQAVTGGVPSSAVAGMIAALPAAAQSALTALPATTQQAVLNAYQQVKNGAGFTNASSLISQYGPQAQQALLSALGPNFNVNASNAAAAAQATNIGTSGTAVTSTAAAGYQQAQTNYQNLYTNYQGALNLGQVLVNTVQNGVINSSGSTDYNQAANTLASHMSSSDYTKFTDTLTALQNMYSNLLVQSGGTTPTTADSQLIQTLNPNAQMSTIINSINQLNTEVYTGKVTPLANQVNTYQQMGDLQ